jgi:hypothetical protein
MKGAHMEHHNPNGQSQDKDRHEKKRHDENNNRENHNHEKNERDYHKDQTDRQ